MARIAVDCGFRLHKELGPGLLESVYEAVLAKLLEREGVSVRLQVAVPISFMDMSFDEGFRADILVEGILLLELKSVETLAPVHSKQLLTYLRLLDLPLGLLMNFGAATFKAGVKRVVNGPQSFVSSCEPIRSPSMSIQHINSISNRLSLRPPQRDSLEILARVCEIVSLEKGDDSHEDTKARRAAELEDKLRIIRSEFPTVEDFERDFPSLCFAIATGVGKTRLMGAFIAYLCLAAQQPS